MPVETLRTGWFQSAQLTSFPFADEPLLPGPSDRQLPGSGLVLPRRPDLYPGEVLGEGRCNSHRSHKEIAGVKWTHVLRPQPVPDLSRTEDEGRDSPQNP